MKEFKTSECGDLENARPMESEHETVNGTAVPSRSFPRVGSVAAVALIASGLIWAIGHEPAKPGLPDFPKPTQTAVNNNLNSRLGLVPDLDGTAIVYAGEADKLVAHGQFRADLSLIELANFLRVSPASIANPRSPKEVDPDAELFRAQAGTLTESGKERSRNLRRQALQEGTPPHAVFNEWVVTNFSFTLNRLKHPNEEERVVLSAIVIAAEETLPKPGDKIRAVGISRGELTHGASLLAPGFLPLEPIEQASDELQARP